MPNIFADRVRETTAITGLGTYDLDGAVTGFQGFVAGIADGNTCFYCVEDGTDWEIGQGTVTDAAPDTLSRDTILASSNADAAVDWGAGIKNIFLVNPAAEIAKTKQWSLLTTLSTASGTSSETTAIPSGTLAIKLVFDQVKQSASDVIQVEIGATSYATVSAGVISKLTSSAVVSSAFSGGPFDLTRGPDATDILSGLIELVKNDDNHWVLSSKLCDEVGLDNFIAVGRGELSAAMDRLKVSLSGAANFDGGGVHVYTYN